MFTYSIPCGIAVWACCKCNKNQPMNGNYLKHFEYDRNNLLFKLNKIYWVPSCEGWMDEALQTAFQYCFMSVCLRPVRMDSRRWAKLKIGDPH